MNKYHAFTYKPGKRVFSLPTNVIVSSSSANPPASQSLRSIWDTGASRSCIAQRVADLLQLVPVGQTRSSTANGIADVNTYFVNIELPNHVTVQDVLVSGADLGDELDVLIGMDIITLGDFSITNVNNETIFSFRYPSIQTIDYVEDASS